MHEPTPIEPAQLEELIREALPGAQVAVIDLTGTRDHYRVEVVADAFAGKTLVQQHQMIYRAVGDHMTQAVHALQIRTRIP